MIKKRVPIFANKNLLLENLLASKNEHLEIGLKDVMDFFMLDTGRNYSPTISLGISDAPYCLRNDCVVIAKAIPDYLEELVNHWGWAAICWEYVFPLPGYEEEEMRKYEDYINTVIRYDIISRVEHFCSKDDIHFIHPSPLPEAAYHQWRHTHTWNEFSEFGFEEWKQWRYSSPSKTSQYDNIISASDSDEDLLDLTAFFDVLAV